MMEQGLSFHFKDGKHIKPTSCNVIEDIYKVWWRPILSLSNWLHCEVVGERKILASLVEIKYNLMAEMIRKEKKEKKTKVKAPVMTKQDKQHQTSTNDIYVTASAALIF